MDIKKFVQEAEKDIYVRTLFNKYRFEEKVDKNISENYVNSEQAVCEWIEEKGIDSGDKRLILEYIIRGKIG